MRCAARLLCLVVLLWPGFVLAQNEPEESKDSELTLEKLFPEKSFFGPSARSTGFSHDGRYGSYLYHPYVERRHGIDLWILDTETGEVERITMVSSAPPRPVTRARPEELERTTFGR